MMGFYEALRYHVVPYAFVLLFTIGAHLWSRIGKDSLLGVGDAFSWWTVCLFLLWAYLWLLAPGSTALGPPDPEGHRPPYKDNGLAYYLATSGLLMACEAVRPGFCSEVYRATPDLIGVLNVASLALCLYLYLDSPPSSLPGMYLFYKGVRLHPRLLGADVKQFTNCRVGMMAWSLLVAANFYHGLLTNGFHMASFTNFAIQMVYVTKFYWKESWYFRSLDMSYDGAGYYMCWGTMVLMPGLWPLSSRLLASSVASASSPWWGSLCLLLGLAANALLHWVDDQRGSFRRRPSAPVWGRPPLSVASPSGAPLLASGFWGILRHPNYTADFLVNLFTALPALHLGHPPFLLVYFLAVLVVHRVFRDEEKCRAKHGQSFEKYCKLVPYRLVPYIF